MLKRLILVLSLFSPVLAQERLSNGEARQLAEHMRSDIVQQYGQIRPLANEVAQVFQQVAAHARRRDVAYRVSLVEDPTINAYALPDGQVVFFSGLVQRLGNRDAMAFVASHEVAHIEHYHTQQRIAQQTVLGTLLGALVGREEFWVQALAGLSGQLVSAGYSRDLEAEADREGMDLLVRSGFDPQGGLLTMKMFKDLEAQSSGIQIFPTHPAAEDRYNEVLGWFDAHDYPLPALALLDASLSTRQLVAQTGTQAQSLYQHVRNRPLGPGEGPARQALLGLAESLNNLQLLQAQNDPEAMNCLRAVGDNAEDFATHSKLLNVEGEHRQLVVSLSRQARQLERQVLLEQAQRCDTVAQYLLARLRRKGVHSLALQGLAESTHNYLLTLRQGVIDRSRVQDLQDALASFQRALPTLGLDTRYRSLVDSLTEETQVAVAAGLQPVPLTRSEP